MKREITKAASVIAAAVTLVVLLNLPTCSVNPHVDLDSRPGPLPTTTVPQPVDVRVLSDD